MILDRTVAPPPKTLAHRLLPSYTPDKLSNGLKVYQLSHGSTPVVEVKVIFGSGISYQKKAGLASYTAKNMLEGTTNFNSLELSQALDNLGAWVNYDVDQEYISFNLATVTHQLHKAIPLLKEVVCFPTFPEAEFQQMKIRDLERLTIEAQKTSYHARRNFSQLLFSKDHPYGMHAGKEEIEMIHHQDLRSYFEQHLHNGNFCITVVGNFNSSEVMEVLEKEFGNIPISSTPLPVSYANSPVPEPQSIKRRVEVPGVQSTIRLGHLGINRYHPEFYKMILTNTILGGYFGSRLMQTIREKKGYTYGIYAVWIGYKTQGLFFIQSDLANIYVEPAIEAIKQEIEKLQQEGVSADELQLVKNYLLGQSISQRETPFQIGNILRFSIAYDIPLPLLDKKFEIFSQMEADEIPILAQKYYSTDRWIEVIAGNPHKG